MSNEFEIQEHQQNEMTIERLDNQHEHDVKINKPLLSHPHSMLIVAPKGAGKSTFIINCLIKKSFYKGYFDKVYIWSPTMKLDDKFNKAIVLPEDQIFEEYEEDDLLDILEEQSKDIIENGKKNSNKILLIFDDMAQSNAFNQSKKNAMTKLFFNLRHYNASLWVASQRYCGAMPLNFRTNLSGLIIFNIPNQKELDKIMSENAGTVNKRQFKTIFDYCMDKPFNFMFLNFQVHHNNMFHKNFNKLKINYDEK
jgi:hypothetical protein|tara:strand:+ start:1940 stop:2698 length:759 start_codon:yes stop_codon:yes gene_type:complete